MIMERTTGEILAKMNSLESGSGDPFGFVRSDLLAFLDYTSAQRYLKAEVNEAAWKPSSRAEEGIVKTITDYLTFAFEKADDERGLSAARSLYHFSAWLWMLGEADAADALMEKSEYYGQNVLAAIAEHFNTPCPWGGDVAELPWRTPAVIPEPSQSEMDHVHHGQDQAAETSPLASGLAPVREGQGDKEPRKAHYGSGEQPWDTIVFAGWGPEFAAGNILKYLRRTKAPEHSLESARWYAQRLVEGAYGGKNTVEMAAKWESAMHLVLNKLSDEERERLGPLEVRRVVNSKEEIEERYS